jgi:hypothetical protein
LNIIEIKISFHCWSLVWVKTFKVGYEKTQTQAWFGGKWLYVSALLSSHHKSWGTGGTSLSIHESSTRRWLVCFTLTLRTRPKTARLTDSWANLLVMEKKKIPHPSINQTHCPGHSQSEYWMRNLRSWFT